MKSAASISVSGIGVLKVGGARHLSWGESPCFTLDYWVLIQNKLPFIPKHSHAWWTTPFSNTIYFYQFSIIKRFFLQYTFVQKLESDSCWGGLAIWWLIMLHFYSIYENCHYHTGHIRGSKFLGIWRKFEDKEEFSSSAGPRSLWRYFIATWYRIKW